MHTSLIDAITLNRQNVEIYTRVYHPCRLLPHRIEDDAFQTPHKLSVPSGSVRFPPEACVLLIQREMLNHSNMFPVFNSYNLRTEWKSRVTIHQCPDDAVAAAADDDDESINDMVMMMITTTMIIFITPRSSWWSMMINDDNNNHRAGVNSFFSIQFQFQFLYVQFQFQFQFLWDEK